MSSGGDGSELMEGVDAGRLRASGSHGLTRVVPAEVLLGSGRSRDRRW
jgi:hypothetical protein